MDEAHRLRYHMNKTITNLVLEEEEGNYDSLSESQGAREESMEDDVESSTSFMNRPARNREEAERQLETLYQQQRARDRLSMDPSCDCTYCDELRSSVPKPEGSEASARAMGGTGGEEDQDGGEGDEEEEEELTVSSGDETHLSKHERRARDKRMFRHIVFVRNLPRKLSRDEMLELFGKYGTVLAISTGSRPQTEGTAYILYGSEDDAQKAIRQLSGIRLKDKYLVLQVHNPKRMLKLEAGARDGEASERMNASERLVEKPGGEEEEEQQQEQDQEEGGTDDESGAEGTFLRMVSAVCKAARGHKVDIGPIKVGAPLKAGEGGQVPCRRCGGLKRSPCGLAS